MKTKLKRGISIVEVIFAVAIASLVIAFISYTMTLFFSSSEAALDTSQALYLAEEGQEILRTIRDSDWNEIDALSNGTTYYLSVSTTTLATTTTTELVQGKYTRSFQLAQVCRDSTTDDIDFACGVGTAVDPSTRQVTFDVAWNTSTTTLTTLLTNLFNI